jgi:hypothetical protein
MVPPLAVDIDGTLTRGDKSVDPRVFDPLRAWEAPVVVATGKSLPYPIGLCEFLGIPINVVTENGGVVYVESDDELVYNGDRAAAQRVADAYVEAGYDLGWGRVDLVNRWRETEVAVSRQSPRGPLDDLARQEDLEVVDTGYAYHVKSPEVHKGLGLEVAAERLGLEPAAFVAVGDSENDADVFGTAGMGIAVANADGTALSAADHVTDASYADGFLEALELAHEL